MNDKSKVDKVLIGMGMPLDLLGWFEEDDRNYEYAPIDDETKVTLKDMQGIKQAALHNEDYPALKQLSSDLKRVFEIGKLIWSNTNDLDYAVAREDFETAIVLKQRIDQLVEERDAFDAIYETSRYEAMIVMKRPVTAELAFA